ncbi:Leucyl/phenylalanyl-tRNA--protein transferase [plant metagenome]|uniref:Leucyl/phenylalanyl-tRNA--protein transferase n=1 Tax=plant metagenome TaxID=1297885 RepID=A0A484PR82_9ZZZZ|nr:leucyl/phenylalanyl-tRNA--protein transferase [Orrella dioscoreae]
MRLPWLEPDTPFPPAQLALRDPDGLLALGADLSVTRLRNAYSQGIFPWFSEGEPILWWSPDPRMVLRCEDFAPPHALAKRLRQLARAEAAGAPLLDVRVDTATPAVLAACAAPRGPGGGTWITAAMQAAYTAWHQAGDVHSIETWIDGELAGGLYGVSLGGMFFGESMFTRASGASKIALAHLVAFLRTQGVDWIDCQQQTAHLASLGARPVPRDAFLAHVREARRRPRPAWARGRLDTQGRLHPYAPAD